MKPGKIDGATDTLVPPPEFNTKVMHRPHALPLKQTKDIGGHHIMLSIWHPETAEIERMVAGAPVQLTVYGAGPRRHPPVMLSVPHTIKDLSSGTEQKPEQQSAEDAIGGLAVSLCLANPILSSPTAERLALHLSKLKDGWIKWAETPPKPGHLEEWVIVGRDALGFVHNASHLIGETDGQAFVEWRRVTI